MEAYVQSKGWTTFDEMQAERKARDISFLKQRIKMIIGVMRSVFHRSNLWMPARASAHLRSHI